MRRTFGVIPLLAVALILWSTLGRADTLHPSDDAFIDTGVPGENNGASTQLHVSKSGGGGVLVERHTFLKFDLSSLPAGAIIAKATLRLFVNSLEQGPEGASFCVHLVEGNWTEETLTAGTFPLADSSGCRAGGAGTATLDYVAVEIYPALVQEWVNDPTSNFGLRILAQTESPDAPVSLTFDSKENPETSHAPELEVVLAPALADGSVTTSMLADWAVTSSKVADGALTGANIGDGSLTGADIANGSLTGANISDGSLTGADIANGTLTGADIANGSLTGAHIGDGSLTGADIANGTLTGVDIANGTLTGADIANGSLTGVDIAPNSVRATRLSPIVGVPIECNGGCGDVNLGTICDAPSALDGIQGRIPISIDCNDVQDSGGALACGGNNICLAFEVTRSTLLNKFCEDSSGWDAVVYCMLP